VTKHACHNEVLDWIKKAKSSSISNSNAKQDANRTKKNVEN